MAGIVAAFAGPVMEVVKWPILRHLSYLFCFNSIISGLKDEAEQLDLETRGLQGQVDSVRHDQDIVPGVESWLSNSNRIKGLKDTILDQVPTVESGCSKLVDRFSLSRRAKKTTDRIKELRLQKNFNPISVPKPPASTQQIPLGMTFEFESRKKIEGDIMATLRGGEMNTIGICGMGGLGKTTMAQRIMNILRKEDVFQEVVITTISQQLDKSKVQVEIGDTLGLKLQDNSPQVRAQKLHDRLTGTKRILLVLDDVWEGLELHGLGIPCDSKGCTILVTSRNKDALSEMHVQKVFGMEVLPLKDAWIFFRERAGTCVDDARVNPIAKEVVGECGGLPIALIAVGATLKDEKYVPIWKDALRQLKLCDQDIPSFIEKVHNPVKLSYKFLRSEQEKSLLLLCCLFPEDARIPLEQLTYCCMGLGIFKGIITSEEAKNKTHTLAKMLKSRSLLLDGFYGGEVRMHDVVRDVCRIIAEQGKYIGGNDCAWISSAELIRERTSGLGFLNLRLLLLTRKSKSEEEFKLDSAFLEGISGLHVLWFELSSLTSLPQGTQQLKNLNTLVLWGCEELKTISVVGELVNLEILICRGCVSLEELPPGMKGLNRLKLLDLNWCERLQSIGRGIISSLVGLEDLKIFNSFKKWEAEDREEMGKNAGLKELQALTNLTCLEIEIEDSTLVAENMHISTKLERFCIRFHTSHDLEQEFKRYEKKMSLSLERETCLGHWIEMQLLRETESLSLRGNGAKIVDLKKCQNIKWLKLRECETTKSIVTTCLYDYVNATVFPSSLEQMVLHSLSQLQEVSISFQNLSSVRISDCPRLPNLANLSTAGNDCLPQLESLRISRCEKMEQVLLWKEEDNNSGSTIINPHHVKFPKLKVIWLDSLPNLDTFCQGIKGIEFPLLTEIRIKDCPKWTGMFSCSGVLESKENELRGGSSNADAYSSHLFCHLQKVSYGNLKVLHIGQNPFCGHEIPASSYQLLEYLIISGCEGSSWSLLSSSIAKNLVNLKCLIIKECDEIVQVIKDDDEEVGDENANLFPKLEELGLRSLPKLVSFCELKCDLVLPSLHRATIEGCPKMENWSLGFVAAPNLEEITTDLDHHLELGVNVSLDRLKKLNIYRKVGNVEYPFYHHNFFTSFLDGLEELRLHRLGSMSSFPYSVAGKLVNLRFLQIYDCGEMVKVIEEEEEEEDEVVVSGGRSTLLFPKLEKLQLTKLPKLESFCERRCVVELPSLRRVTINECPMMKSFSLRPLTAPNLEFIEIDNNKYIVGGEKDLNGAVQQHYLARQKDKKEEGKAEAKTKKNEKKEGDEEEQKSKDDEIQDHQT